MSTWLATSCSTFSNFACSNEPLLNIPRPILPQETVYLVAQLSGRTIFGIMFSLVTSTIMTAEYTG